MVVVAGTENPWVRRRKIKLAELVDEPWTWPSAGTMMDSLLVDAFRASGLEPPRVTVHIDGSNIRIRLAATGRFLAVIPAGVLGSPAKHAAIKMLPVDLPATNGAIGIITLKNRTMSPLAQLFIECARDVGKLLAKGK